MPDNSSGTFHNRVRDSSGQTASEQGLDGLLLDHISTSQKGCIFCPYGAPLMALVIDGKAALKQCCCNHWDCPICQWTLAAYHRHRMVEGAKLLAAQGPLYFWTITCRGKDLDMETADDEYYTWTNRLLSTCRAASKRMGTVLAYFQVTERQQRGAAHSHLLTNWTPPDSYHEPVQDDPFRYFSAWFVARNVSAGLGPQCRISMVENAEKAAGYIAKYLKKQLDQHQWPRKWKRIRYSENWLDMARTAEWAQVLRTRADWTRADNYGDSFEAPNADVLAYAKHHMYNVIGPVNETNKTI